MVNNLSFLSEVTDRTSSSLEEERKTSKNLFEELPLLEGKEEIDQAWRIIEEVPPK